MWSFGLLEPVAAEAWVIVDMVEGRLVHRRAGSDRDAQWPNTQELTGSDRVTSDETATDRLPQDAALAPQRGLGGSPPGWCW